MCESCLYFHTRDAICTGTRFGTRFSRQSTPWMSEKSGTDARFPYELRQNVVVGLVVFLLREQEVAGSNPVAPTDKSKPHHYLAVGLLLSVQTVLVSVPVSGLRANACMIIRVQCKREISLFRHRGDRISNYKHRLIVEYPFTVHGDDCRVDERRHGREGLTSFFPEKRAQLDAMVTEAGLSRNYGGIHYKFDCETGQARGRNVARVETVPASSNI